MMLSGTTLPNVRLNHPLSVRCFTPFNERFRSSPTDCELPLPSDAVSCPGRGARVARTRYPRPTGARSDGQALQGAGADGAQEGRLRPHRLGRPRAGGDDTARSVHSGKELLDIDLDNGEQMRAVPTFDIVGVC